MPVDETASTEFCYTHEQLHAMLSCCPVPLYCIGERDHRLLFVNTALKALLPHVCTGMHCRAAFSFAPYICLDCPHRRSTYKAVRQYPWAAAGKTGIRLSILPILWQGLRRAFLVTANPIRYPDSLQRRDSPPPRRPPAAHGCRLNINLLSGSLRIAFCDYGEIFPELLCVSSIRELYLCLRGLSHPMDSAVTKNFLFQTLPGRIQSARWRQRLRSSSGNYICVEFSIPPATQQTFREIRLRIAETPGRTQSEADCFRISQPQSGSLPVYF